MTRRVLLFLAGLLPALLAGCGESGLHYVTGTVLYDGAPLKEGRLMFRNLEGDKRAYSTPITDGNYGLLCGTGKMRVEIIASRIIPGKFDTSNGTREPVGEMYIPARYNSRSDLTAVIDSSNLHHRFELQAK